MRHHLNVLCNTPVKSHSLARMYRNRICNRCYCHSEGIMFLITVHEHDEVSCTFASSTIKNKRCKYMRICVCARGINNRIRTVSLTHIVLHIWATIAQSVCQSARWQIEREINSYESWLMKNAMFCNGLLCYIRRKYVKFTRASKLRLLITQNPFLLIFFKLQFAFESSNTCQHQRNKILGWVLNASCVPLLKQLSKV